jgi:hypothetical protein
MSKGMTLLEYWDKLKTNPDVKVDSNKKQWIIKHEKFEHNREWVVIGECNICGYDGDQEMCDLDANNRLYSRKGTVDLGQNICFRCMTNINSND